MSPSSMIEEARENVDPFCGNCVSFQRGVCVVLANGSCNHLTLNTCGIDLGDKYVTERTSCLGKMRSLGIESHDLPFAPRPGTVAREFIRLLVANTLPASHY